MEEEAAEANAYEEEARDELYCMLNSKIVGVNYYTGLHSLYFISLCTDYSTIGLVGPREEIRLVREPRNHYDR
jgi:SWI/SNF-related matrix-associated actin-dependent regulator of chromatin subfamily A3